MLITIKFLRVLDSNFSKIHPLKCSNRGARARCAGAGSAFDLYECMMKFYGHILEILRKNFRIRRLELDFVSGVPPAGQFDVAQLGVKRVEGDVDPAMGGEHPGLFPLHFPRVCDAVQKFGVGYNAQV